VRGNTHRGLPWTFPDPVRPISIIGCGREIRDTIAAMMRALVPAFAALAALFAACSQGGDGPPEGQQPNIASTPAPASCAPARVKMSGDYALTLPGEDGERPYYLHIPPSYGGATATPLVLAFPASQMDAAAFAGFAALPAGSDRDGYLLAILELEDGRIAGATAASMASHTRMTCWMRCRVRSASMHRGCT
jgi:hypothetical protein